MFGKDSEMFGFGTHIEINCWVQGRLTLNPPGGAHLVGMGHARAERVRAKNTRARAKPEKIGFFSFFSFSFIGSGVVSANFTMTMSDDRCSQSRHTNESR